MKDVLGIAALVAGVTFFVVAVVVGIVVFLHTEPHSTESLFADAARSTPTASASAPASSNSEDPALEKTRLLLAGLAKNPKAVKPSAITPAGEEPHTTYEYVIPNVGDVVQWRVDTRRWEIFITGSQSPKYFARSDGIYDLDHAGAFQWWRVKSGPFTGAFIMSSPGGISVRSRESVCTTPPPTTLPLVARECRS